MIYRCFYIRVCLFVLLILLRVYVRFLRRSIGSYLFVCWLVLYVFISAFC